MNNNKCFTKPGKLFMANNNKMINTTTLIYI